MRTGELRISVITAVKGGMADYLEALYESLCRQQMPLGWEWQWVLQEDGDTGEPAAMLPSDPRISPGMARWGGAARARTLALARADGDLIRAELGAFLAARGRRPVEGSSPPLQQEYLRALTRELGARLVGEVGHDVVRPAKEFIDLRFPDRHELVLGDSKSTLSLNREEHPEKLFDLVFIDGGHDFETARSDIAAMQSMCRQGGDVIVDDLMPWHRFGVGPAKAWEEAVTQARIVPIELIKDGQRVAILEPPGCWAWGRGRYR